MSVVSFPNTPRVDQDTRGIEVVVAPRGDAYLAWVRTERGWAVLEECPDFRHALNDGRIYAARHALPFRLQRAPLDPSTYNPERSRGGEIWIGPSCLDGGSWELIHVDQSDGSAAVVGGAFAFDEAVAEGRRLAQDMGATFDGDGDVAPGPVAA